MIGKSHNKDEFSSSYIKYKFKKFRARRLLSVRLFESLMNKNTRREILNSFSTYLRLIKITSIEIYIMIIK